MDFSLIYWIAAIGLVIFAARYVIVFRTVSRLGCQRPSLSKVEIDDIPKDYIKILGLADSELVSLGFRFLGYLSMRSPLYQSGDQEPDFIKVFLHPAANSLCSVNVNSFWQWNSPINLSFKTLFQDGHSIETSSILGSFGLPLPDSINLVDAETTDIQSQWHQHCQRCQKYTRVKPIKLPTLNLAIKAGNLELEKVFDFWLQRRALVQNSDNSLSLSFKQSLSLSSWLMKALGRTAKFNQKTETLDDDTLLSWQRLLIPRMIFEGQNNSRWLGNLLLFSVTAILFSISFGIAFSWDFVPVLFGVLLFHELGHFLAMKMTGHKDLQIFFVPLLGAAVTGKNHEASALQQLFVYLMGPVPGLLLSIPVTVYGIDTGNQLMISIGMVAFILNYINLLPITPLDGGRVIDTLLLSRLPRAQFVFALLSALALLTAGVMMQEKVMLIVGALLLFGLPSHWTFGRINVELQRLKRDRSTDSDNKQLTIDALEAPSLDNIKMKKKLEVCKQVYKASHTQHAGLAAAVLGMFIYIASLGSPIFVFAGIHALGLGTDALALLDTKMLDDFSEPVSEQNWQQLLDEAETDRERLRVLNGSIYPLMTNSPQIAQQNIIQAIEIGFGLPTDDEFVEQTYRALQYSNLHTSFKIEQLQRAINHHRENTQDQSLLGNLYLKKAHTLSNREEKTRAYQTAIALLTEGKGKQHYQVTEARIGLAKTYYSSDQFDEAERLLKLNADTSDELTINDIELLWFYIASNQQEKLIRQSSQWLEQIQLLQDPTFRETQRRMILVPLMLFECHSGHRQTCFDYLTKVESTLDIEKNTYHDEEHNSEYFDFENVSNRIIAYHLLGETHAAQQLAQEFLDAHPGYRAEPLQQSADYSKAAWNRLEWETRDQIRDTYLILPYY